MKDSEIQATEVVVEKKNYHAMKLNFTLDGIPAFDKGVNAGLGFCVIYDVSANTPQVSVLCFCRCYNFQQNASL